MNFRSRNSSKTGKKMKSEEKRPEKKRPEEKKAIPNNKKRNPEGNQAGEPNFEKSETKERNPEGNQAGEPNLEKSETKERNPGENKAGEPNFEKSETRERKLKKNKADELKPEQRKTAGPSRGEKASGKARPKIGIGYRVAGLQVEEATGQRKNGYMVWRCRCGCGGILLDTRCLQRGTVTDCGCMSRVKPGQRDITGQRFGMLTALEPTEQILYESVVWRCICDCGNEIHVPLRQLTLGYRKSCGCLSHPSRKDYIGRRFGRLTVTDYAGKCAGMHQWKCVCDCGRETVVGQTRLQSGKTKSCGCLQSEIYRKNLKLIDGTSVTILEAGKNHRLIATNTSGHTGVYRDKKRSKWIAQITFKGKTYYLGSYDDKLEAVKAREQGEEMHEDFLEWYYNVTRQEKTCAAKNDI